MTSVPRNAAKLAALALVSTALGTSLAHGQADSFAPDLLSDPFLQLPTEEGVHVVWFTEYEGDNHQVMVGSDFGRMVEAETTKMSRLAEDASSWVGAQEGDGSVYEDYTPRDVWRHEAYVDGLTAGERTPYFVSSETDAGASVESRAFSLQPLPAQDQDLTILLTSDHQLKEMTPANMQKVVETVGEIDAVFLSGDLQNHPDSASQWFDDTRGFAFFPALQGNADYTLERTREENGVTITTETDYQGGAIIQNAPLFPVIGNHEVMGRFNTQNSIGGQFNDPRPRAVAEALYEENAHIYNPEGDPEIREQWIADNSFNTITYEEIFTLPEDGPAGEQYYALNYGDIAMVGLYGTRIWRSPSVAETTRGKYREAQQHLDTPNEWGWGEFIFRDIADGSTQNAWLEETLASEAFQNAPYRIALMHHSAHGLGDNANPAFTDPRQVLEYDEAGRLDMVRYEYPVEDDIFLNDVEPLLSEAGVDLVHHGHSHVWWRLQNEAGMMFLETSNVGNNYGCYLDGYAERGNGPGDERWNLDNYVLTGDPAGLEPIMPSEMAPMQSDALGDLPCIATNDMTAFTILETGSDAATVSSYVFDVTRPESDVALFDQFALER